MQKFALTVLKRSSEQTGNKTILRFEIPFGRDAS